MFYFILTHFSPMFTFYTPLKCQKTKGSGGIEMEHWAKMGWYFPVFCSKCCILETQPAFNGSNLRMETRLKAANYFRKTLDVVLALLLLTLNRFYKFFLVFLL